MHPVPVDESSLRDFLALSLFIGIVMGLVVGAIARSRGRSLAGWCFLGLLFGLLALIAVLVIPRASRPVSAAAPEPVITYTNAGRRWQLGYSLVDPMWAIWDRWEPGPPHERFPYTEEGRARALARFSELEPTADDAPPLPPPPATRGQQP
jgi:hypothetical protein